MKIFVLTIMIFVINGYLTEATSLDPLENAEMENAKSDDDKTRTKRSGELLSLLLRKKFGLFSSLAGSSSGKSIPPDHFNQPLSYHTKTSNLVGVKKSIMSSLFQAAKAITGGVIALKGQLLKAKGHVVVAKGKIMQTKGEAITNFGQNLATHAFDVHHSPHLDVGLYNHLPVAPIHQPTSYGVPTALAYQAPAYPNPLYATQSISGHGYTNNVYPSNGYLNQAYPVPSPGLGVPGTHSGYDRDGSADYAGYGVNTLTAKRGVANVAQESNVNQVKSDSHPEQVRAGLLIFKPINMAQNSGNPLPHSANIQNIINQRSSLLSGAIPVKTSQITGYQNVFPGFQSPQYQVSQSNEYQVPQSNEYQVPSQVSYSSNTGYPAQGSGYPVTGSVGERNEGQRFLNHNIQQAANGQQVDRQLTHHESYSSDNYSGDQTNSNEHAEQPSYAYSHHSEMPEQMSLTTNPERFSVDHSFPTTTKYSSDDHSAYARKRNAPKFDELVTVTSTEDSLVPLEYLNDSGAKEQSRLKQTVERFFKMLQKQPCE